MKRKEKLVYRGKIFKVYQWRQRMFDGTYETFERVERPSSAQVIAVADGKIVTTIQSQPGRPRFRSLIGGRIDEGETPLQAAKRELLEEAGMVAARWKLLKKDTAPTNKIVFGIYLFAAAGCRKVADQKLDSGEKIRLKTITLGELLDWRRANARIGPDIALYFNELKHDPRARRRLESALGISHSND